MSSLNVLVIDRNEDFYSQCSGILASETTINVNYSSELTALETLCSIPTDVVVIGQGVNQDHKLHLLQLINLRWTTCKVLMVVDNQSETEAVSHLEASAVGFLHREDAEQFLTKALRKIHEGEAWVPRKMVPSLVERFKIVAA